MVVVEHQPGALLVGVEEGHRSGARIGHVGNVAHADALGIGGVLTSRRGPLVRRAVADPGGDAAVQVQGGAVLGEAVRSASGYSPHMGLRTPSVTLPSSGAISIGTPLASSIIMSGPGPEPISEVSTGRNRLPPSRSGAGCGTGCAPACPWWRRWSVPGSGGYRHPV